jgi:hypothetical protein
LTGTAEAGSAVAIFDGATQIGTAKANAGGAWRFTTPELSNANHYLTARATDAAGNTSSASPLLNIKVDTTGTPSPTPAGENPLVKGSFDVPGQGSERAGFSRNDGSNNTGQALTKTGYDFSAAAVSQPELGRPTTPIAVALSDSFILLPLIFSAIIKLRRSGSRSRVDSRSTAPTGTARRGLRS